MLGFPIAILFANGFEWYAHKYVLHGTPRPGQGRRSPRPDLMKAHWAHHKVCRQQDFDEPGYREGLKNERVRLEASSLVLTAGAFTLLAPVAPFFVLGAWYSAGHYYYVHRRSHLDPAWAKQHVPWHYDHHMNSNQDANWCVTRPWFDYLMGTRVISSEELMESNPLGMKLPKVIEKPLNRLARRLSPRAFEKLEANRRREAANRAAGRDETLPAA
jgi:hypothetical protein